MPVLIKQTGAWKNTSPSIKSGGVWKQTRNVHIKQAGLWKPLWTYNWEIGNWGLCSASCGGGTQYRTVTCKRSDGIASPDAYCTGTKPNASQSCNTHSCVTYSWYTGSYGTTCSVVCGTGTVSRPVYCRRDDGTQMSDSYCGGGKPSATKSCTATCYWQYQAWSGVCSASCGIGNETRPVNCISNYVGYSTKVGAANCGNIFGTPDVNRSCTKCTGCSFHENSVVYYKQQKAIIAEGVSLSLAELRSMMIAASGSVQGWWNQYGKAEGVCPWNSSDCCIQDGYRWYGLG